MVTEVAEAESEDITASTTASKNGGSLAKAAKKLNLARKGKIKRSTISQSSRKKKSTVANLSDRKKILLPDLIKDWSFLLIKLGSINWST